MLPHVVNLQSELQLDPPSHCSPTAVSVMLLPHTSLDWQCALQPSPAIALPSSHASPGSSRPLPQSSGLQASCACVQVPSGGQRSDPWLLLHTMVCSNSQGSLRCPPEGTCTQAQDACKPDDCGNGRLDPGEACDDGNAIAGDGCSAHCQSKEVCGNNITDTAVGEQCDGGSNCSSDCRFTTCGNMLLDQGEECDTGKDTRGCNANCTFPSCGD